MASKRDTLDADVTNTWAASHAPFDGGSALEIAPGVLLLQPNAPIDIEQRRKAIASIFRQLRQAKPPPKGQSGRDLLAQVRARHIR
jgi:hypothetical protein